MASFDVLRAYLEARATFTDDDLALLREVFLPRTLRAGEFLQRAGDVATHAAFVASGCLRSYVIDDNGKEHVVMFAPETWWVGDNASLISGAPSQYFVDAVENSDILLISPAGHHQVLERLPAYAAGFRTGLLKHAAAKDQRIVTSLTASAEERYLDFMKTYPSIAQRVPQWMIASYLGLTPETLSRIRRQLSRK